LLLAVVLVDRVEKMVKRVVIPHMPRLMLVEVAQAMEMLAKVEQVAQAD
jgi:hypothetical protein